MGKPWARYEIGFINHPKFRALNPNAICLWWECKNYCDEFLNDGIVPKAVAKGFRFYSTKSMDMLTRSCGLKPNREPYAPLWEGIDIGDVPHVRMHDYLEHNDCREAVMARIQQAEQRKDADRERKAFARAAKEAKSALVHADNPADNHADTGADRPVDMGADTLRNPRNVRVYTETETKETRDRARDDSDRAAALVERYPKIYAKCRSGAHYQVREARDFEAFQTLIAIERSDERLDRLLELFFAVKARDFLNVPGTPRQFLHMFPECDRLLRERGL